MLEKILKMYCINLFTSTVSIYNSDDGGGHSKRSFSSPCSVLHTFQYCIQYFYSPCTIIYGLAVNIPKQSEREINTTQESNQRERFYDSGIQTGRQSGHLLVVCHSLLFIGISYEFYIFTFYCYIYVALIVSKEALILWMYLVDLG